MIITGLNVSRVARDTFADEVGWLAAIFLGLSCLFSYFAIRAESRHTAFEPWADRVFILGLLAPIASVVVLAVSTAWAG